MKSISSLAKNISKSVDTRSSELRPSSSNKDTHDNKKIRKRLTPGEIREKVKASKIKVAQVVEKKEDTQEDKVHVTVRPMGKADVNANDPNSSITQDKLRKLLSTKGFNYSDKQRQVLDKILNN